MGEGRFQMRPGALIALERVVVAEAGQRGLAVIAQAVAALVHLPEHRRRGLQAEAQVRLAQRLLRRKGARAVFLE